MEEKAKKTGFWSFIETHPVCATIVACVVVTELFDYLRGFQKV